MLKQKIVTKGISSYHVWHHVVGEASYKHIGIYSHNTDLEFFLDFFNHFFFLKQSKEHLFFFLCVRGEMGKE